MKNAFWLALMIAGFVYPGYQAFAAEPETKKVCVDAQGKDGKPIMDPKTKKPKQYYIQISLQKKPLCKLTAVINGRVLLS